MEVFLVLAHDLADSKVAELHSVVSPGEEDIRGFEVSVDYSFGVNLV